MVKPLSHTGLLMEAVGKCGTATISNYEPVTICNQLKNRAIRHGDGLEPLGTNGSLAPTLLSEVQGNRAGVTRPSNHNL